MHMARSTGLTPRLSAIDGLGKSLPDALVLPAPKAAKADLDADVSARHGKPAVTVGREARAAPSDAPARGADCGVEAVIETISPFVPLGFFVPPADGEGWRLPASLARRGARAPCAGTASCGRGAAATAAAGGASRATAPGSRAARPRRARLRARQ